VTGDEPGGVAAPESGPNEYRAPRGWDKLGAETPDEDLVMAAVEWISANSGFLMSQARSRERYQDIASDAISRIIIRARGGHGLTNALRKHVTGEDWIEAPPAILLYYLERALGEERRERQRTASRELPIDPTDSSDTTFSGAPVDHDVDSAYSRLIEVLQCRFEEFLPTYTGGQPADDKELKCAYAHLDEMEAQLLNILHRYIPSRVRNLAANWDDDQRRCVLVGIFPLKNSVRNVYWYRLLRSRNTTRKITFEGTEKMINRLRKKIKGVWPSGPDDDPTGEVCVGRT